MSGVRDTVQRQLLERAVFTIAYLLFLSFVVYARPNKPIDVHVGTDAADIIRYVCEAIVVVGCVFLLIQQVAGEIVEQGVTVFIASLVGVVGCCSTDDYCSAARRTRPCTS